MAEENFILHKSSLLIGDEKPSTAPVVEESSLYTKGTSVVAAAWLRSQNFKSVTLKLKDENHKLNYKKYHTEILTKEKAAGVTCVIVFLQSVCISNMMSKWGFPSNFCYCCSTTKLNHHHHHDHHQVKS